MVKVLLVVILLISLIPFLINFLVRVEYPVHKEGVIVISGCSSGIGRHAAFEMAKHGYVVFAGVRKDSDKESLNKEFREKKPKGKVIPVILDVTTQSSIDSSFQEVTAYLDANKLPFVGLVNNAGVAFRAPFESQDLQKAKELFEVNYWGALALTQKFLPIIRQYKSRVVFMSSLMGIGALYASTAYAGSKFATEAASMPSALKWQNSAFL